MEHGTVECIGAGFESGYEFSETFEHLTGFREENYFVPEETHHFFICGTNLMADILSDDYPAVTFLKWVPELR